MNECLQDRYCGSDAEVNGPMPQEKKKFNGLMSERNVSLSSQVSRGLSAPLGNHTPAKRAAQSSAAEQSFVDVERSL